MRTRGIATALGPIADKKGGVWTLDLSRLPIFRGLSVMSRALGELVLEQTRADRIDVSVERAVNARENPELHDLGVSRVKVWGEQAVMSRFAGDPELFQEQLRVMFGTLQRQRYREALLPSNGARARALIFYFSAPGAARRQYRASLESLRSSAVRGQRYLRVTIEHLRGRRLHLASLPHLVVADLDRRTFIAGSTRIAQTWREGITREAERGRRMLAEATHPRSHTFSQFAKAGLGDISEVNITWPDAFVPRLLDTEPASIERFLKHVLLALEDRDIRTLLARGETVRIVSGDQSAFLDRSHLGRVLNVSIGCARERLDVDAFLDRMPHTARPVAGGDRSLAGVRVLLIHHVTAEVVGLIAALRALGCRDLVTLFIAYGGDAPGSLLGPLLDLPADEFRCLALTHVPEQDRVEGRYCLSPRYSKVDDAATLAAAVAAGDGRFESAMRTVAVSEFMALLERARSAGDRCLLIEDGGYLGPSLNAAAFAGRTVREFLQEVGLPCEDERPLDGRLRETFVGSVEHTRNGYDRLAAVQNRCGMLAYPALSIAISNLKMHEESREVAVSILNAVESILHATGRVLSRRTCLVIGSRGAIGRSLMRALGQRLHDRRAQLFGIDLQASPGAPLLAGVTETRRYQDLDPEDRRRIDLVIGVTGHSVLTGSDIEEWLRTASAPELVLASGSSKTSEFSGVAEWLDTQLREGSPRIGPAAVQIDGHEIRDSHTGRLFGHRYRFALDGAPARRRDIVCLANLTPVNFLFYGVPNEAIDEVIAQLLRCAVALATRPPGCLPPRLLAVDHDITADGELIGEEHQPVRARGHGVSMPAFSQ